MRYFYLFIAFIFSITNCTTTIEKDDSTNKSNSAQVQEVFYQELQNILDSNQLEGVILIHPAQMDTFYSNHFAQARIGQLPASTFKIPNSIIALETGVVENDSTLLKWNGEDHWLDVWEQDLIFKDAFRFSCLPCYQEIARMIGEKRMRTYLDRLDYSSRMIFDTSNIDLFWVQSASTITPFEQIDFLERLYFSNLPIAKRTEQILKEIMLIEENANYKLSGKTGWSIQDEVNNGWFVGWIEAKNETYFFATNVYPRPEFDMALFPSIRQEITLKAFKALNILEKK